VARDLNIGAVKIGMLATSEIIEAVAGALETLPGVPVVLDPVMVAASGDVLLDEDAIDTLRTVLLPHATLVTPNLPEAAKLLGEAEAKDERAMSAQAAALRRLGAKVVLIKGGHAEGDQAVDILIDDEGELRLEAPRIPTGNTHGTGCTLSSAIAAELAKGASLREAAARAKAYVSAAIAAADQIEIGQGRGPVHHFHRWWK
jgi:hydroxymethylpyrimidine/phosphomethylpyrimidine kinase